MNLADYSIQKKIQGGDISEYEKIFTRYYEPLCRHSFRIVKDMDVAEDLVQEFFYNLWKNRATFSPKLNLEAYLFQAIRNNSLHYLEHLQVRKQYADSKAKEPTGIVPAEENSKIAMNELNRLITITLGRLPKRCAQVFRLNRFGGKKYREIAAILSISEKTVEADMGNALKMFRLTLKEYDITTSK